MSFSGSAAATGRWSSCRPTGCRPPRTKSAGSPHNINAAIGLANAHHALGELPQAERVLREAARRDPESVIVLNNLAQTLSDQNRDAEALPFIERAVALGGPHAGAADETRQAILGRLAAQRKN